ncbi:MAG: hypothetical protein KC417_09880, partial [Myxococcales bacterium]|nr:hypothetical protein [Myxococcales bacterium]
MRLLLRIATSVLFTIPTFAAAQVALDVPRAAEGEVRVDGALLEWPDDRVVSVGKGDGSFVFAVAETGAGLAVGARVDDNRFLSGRDAVEVSFASGRAVVRVRLEPGTPGKSSGRAMVGAGKDKPRADRRVQMVEGPARDADGRASYVVEAMIPWAVLPTGIRSEGRLHVQVFDVDSEASGRAEHSFAFGGSTKDQGTWTDLRFQGGTGSLLRSFVRSANLPLGIKPRRTVSGNVAGDRRPEQVSLVDRYVLVMGDGYRGGTAYSVLSLPVSASKDIRTLDLVDVTGDGIAEIIVAFDEGNDLGRRRLWGVFAANDRGVEGRFTAEIGKATGDGSLEGRVEVIGSKKGGPPVLRAHVATSNGLTAENFREAPAGDAAPLLLPWGPVESVDYRWDGARFVEVGHVPSKNEPMQTASTATVRTTTRTPASSAAQAAPKPPSRAELLAAIHENIGVPRNAKPDFQLKANVAADERAEEVRVYGTTLVVFGPGYRGGAAWFATKLPAESPDAIRSVEAHRVTNNGRAQLVLVLRRT